jgi:hypothetical protein
MTACAEKPRLEGERQPNTPTGAPDLQLPVLEGSTLRDYVDFLEEAIKQIELQRQYYWQIAKDTPIRSRRFRVIRHLDIYYEGLLRGLYFVLGNSYDRLQKEAVA